MLMHALARLHLLAYDPMRLLLVGVPQHSGQHLVTAVTDRDFGYKTVSWSLG